MSEVFYERGKKYNCRKKGVPYFLKTVVIQGKRRYVYGDGEKDALNQIAELRKKVNTGIELDNRKAKFGETMKYWLYNVKRVDADVKASSFSRYECSFRCHVQNCSIYNLKLEAVNAVNMQAYITSLAEEQNLSVATIKNTMKVLRMFFKWALDEGYIQRDPTRNISIPGRRESKERVIETFTAEERRKIAEYMRETGYEYDTLITLAFATGMRKGELLALKWEDIENGSIRVCKSTAVVTHIDKDGNRDNYREVWDPKTKNAYRLIPLLPATAEMLRAHKRAQKEYFMSRGIRSEYVFTTMEGKIVDSCSLTKSFHRLLDRAGVPQRKFHAIRHTFATEAIKAGVDVKDLQILMGHSDIDTTYIYVHATEETKRTAIEKMGAMM